MNFEEERRRLQKEIRRVQLEMQRNGRRQQRKARKKRRRQTELVRVNKHWHKRLKEDAREYETTISKTLDKICFRAYRVARTKSGRLSLFTLNDEILMENEELKGLLNESKEQEEAQEEGEQ